jgi:hypothetical protein
MDMNSSQAEAMKTCFGILAIMSREDSNKLLIAKDGMEIILNAMTVHVDRTDVQESGCDLLWSLAFNSSAVKDIIAKHGGAVVLVRALKRHSRSADFLKSACGALSNMCQCKLNQEGVSTQGGLQPLVGSIHVHQTNAKLLPFIFDAIASIIVNNEENARTVSSLGIVPVVVASLSRHKTCMEVVKSGCHTLAILSDVKGQASKIAFAGGVPIILSLLDAHPLYSDLHRVAAVVLLRMLQESAHVGREITCHEGVRILLNSLEKGGAQQDTVAAVTHILYTVTNPSSPASATIESQLWLPASANAAGNNNNTRSMSVSGTSIDVEGSSPNAAARKHSIHSLHGGTHDSAANSSGNNLTALLGLPGGLSSHTGGSNGAPAIGNTALGGVVMILGQYSARRDVVRAACRLINNLSGFTNVVPALDRLNILDRIFECASIHRDTKDVTESATALLKTIHKRSIPVLAVGSPPCVQGLLHLFRVKLADEEMATACLDTMTRLIETTYKMNITPEKRRELEDSRMVDGKLWEHSALSTALTLLHGVVEAENGEAGEGKGSVAAPGTTSSPSGKVIWNKGTAKVVASVLSFIETVYHTHKLAVDALLYKDTFDVLSALLRIMPYKSMDLTRRIERILPMIECLAKHPLMEKAPGFGSRKNLLSLKPPLPGNTAASTEDAASGGFMFNGVHLRKGEEGSSAPSGNGSSGSSPLVMGRRVREAGGAGADVASDVSSEDGKGLVKSRSWGSSLALQGAGALGSAEAGAGAGAAFIASAGQKSTLPQHPLKQLQQRQQQAHAGQGRGTMSGIGRNSGGGQSSSSSPAPSSSNLVGIGAAENGRLLENWPNYLERLSLSPNLSANRSYLNPTGQDSSTPTRMQLSYESVSAAGRGLLSKCPTPVPYIVPPTGLGEPFEHSLTFDSDFESGNLLRAVQKGDANYDLFLRSDLHTPGHTQWFYFAVANTHPPELVKLAEQGVEVPPVRVRFNIVNFTKPDSLFNLGMRPVVYSVRDAAKKNIGWVRAGADISYYGNSFLRNNSAGEGLAYYYTLTFTLEFHNPEDTILVAYSYPYTMSDYRSHLAEILDKPSASDCIRQFRLCQTLSGEDCDLLVITNFADKEKEKLGPLNIQQVDLSANEATAFGGSKSSTTVRGSRRQQQQLKPALFLSCRVHPGETPASWMMKGMLEFLTSDCSQAVLLRQVFVIFIVPMLNPDGVIFGNNRCSLAGVDLNRQWKLPIKAVHPTIFHLKYFMQAQRRLREVSMYIDLHGHSRKYNVFMYGCDDKKKPKPQVRAFPKFFSMHNVGKKYVCYADCSFTVKKGRESTARVVVAKEINIPCSFTLEATFCGSNYGPLKHCHMNIGHMQEVGTALCDAILNFSISEGQVKDTLLVPGNLRAVAQVEKAIAAEGLGGSAADNSGSEKGEGGGHSARERREERDGTVSVKRTSNATVHAANRKLPTTGQSAVGVASGTATPAPDSADYENLDGDNSSRSVRGQSARETNSASEDCDNDETADPNSYNSEEVNADGQEGIREDEGLGQEAENEEVDSGSDDDNDSCDEPSDGDSVFALDKSRGDASARSEPGVAEDGRLRVASLNTLNTSGLSMQLSQAPGSAGSSPMTLPGMSKVLVASGRQTIMSGSSAAEKMNSIRAMATPSVSSSSALRTLSPAGPGGALTLRNGGAASLLKSDLDSSAAFGEVSDGIASLQLGGTNIASAGLRDRYFIADYCWSTTSSLACEFYAFGAVRDRTPFSVKQRRERKRRPAVVLARLRRRAATVRYVARQLNIRYRDMCELNCSLCSRRQVVHERS